MVLKFRSTTCGMTKVSIGKASGRDAYSASIRKSGSCSSTKPASLTSASSLRR